MRANILIVVLLVLAVCATAQRGRNQRNPPRPPQPRQPPPPPPRQQQQQRQPPPPPTRQPPPPQQPPRTPQPTQPTTPRPSTNDIRPLPEGYFNNPTCNRIRRSWYDLTTEEKELFVEACSLLKQSGEWDQFQILHNDATNRVYAHGQSGFFVWHRRFLFEFENALRDLGPRFACLTVPYWPFEREAGNEGTTDIFRYLGGPSDVTRQGCVSKAPFNTWRSTDGTCLRRTFDQQYSFIGEARLVDVIVSTLQYGEGSGYRSLIEGAPHAGCHNFIGGGGGQMGTMNSPADPFFYVLHCNVDRLFSIWSDCHDYDTGSLGPNSWPSQSTAFGQMPFFYQGSPHRRFVGGVLTPADVYRIGTNALPYIYDPNDRLVGLIQSTAGNAASCRFNSFAIGTGSATKRNLEEDQETQIGDQLVKFSDARVQKSYDDICTKEIPDAPKLYQIHATAIAECNICTGHGRRRHASAQWIREQNMEDQAHVFEPICGNGTQSLSATYTPATTTSTRTPATYTPPATTTSRTSATSTRTPAIYVSQIDYERDYYGDDDEEYDYNIDYGYDNDYGYGKKYEDKDYGYDNDNDYGYGNKYDDKDYGYGKDDRYGYDRKDRYDNDYGYGKKYDDKDYGYENKYNNKKYNKDDGYGYENKEYRNYDKYEKDYGYGKKYNDKDYGYGNKYDNKKYNKDDYGYGNKYDDKDYGYGNDRYGYDRKDKYDDKDYGRKYDDKDYGYGKKYDDKDYDGRDYYYGYDNDNDSYRYERSDNRDYGKHNQRNHKEHSRNYEKY